MKVTDGIFRVVCVVKSYGLTKGSTYVVNKKLHASGGITYYLLVPDDGVEASYLSTEFITLEEHRNNQLNKLL